MEVDSPPPPSTPHSSPVSSRLSVVCSLSEVSALSSASSSPNSRRNSLSEKSKSDVERRLRALSEENERLRAQLEASRPAVFDLPYPGTPAPLSAAGLLDAATLQKLHALYPGVVVSPPVLQLAQLQAALHSQFGSTLLTASHNGVLQPNPQALISQPGPSTSSSSAGVPISKKDSVIRKTGDHQSPDSSTDRKPSTSKKRELAVLCQVSGCLGSSSASTSAAPQPQPQNGSILGALLANRRPSPTVPQSSTERRSGLASPIRETNHNQSSSPSNVGSSISHSSSKSDTESHSSASLSPHGPRAPDDFLDGDRQAQYFERRRRNNEAAKRCRANRRAVFEYRSRRVEILETENSDLRREIEELKTEIERCKALIVARERHQL